MNKNLIAPIIRAAWRRRYLFAIPLMVLLPASALLAWLAPRQYQASALIMLPESPGIGGSQAGYGFSQEMAAKVKGLDALLRSELVLSEVLSRGLPGDVQNGGPMLERIEDLRRRLGTRQVSDNFVQITLLDTRHHGLGEQLNAVLAALFEGLLSPANSATDAVSFVVRQRQAEIESIERRIKELEAKAPNLAESMVRDQESASKAAEERITAKQQLLEVERTKLQRALEAIVGPGNARLKDPKAPAETLLAQLIADRQAALDALAKKGEADSQAGKDLAQVLQRLGTLSSQQSELAEFADEIRNERSRVDSARATARNLASLMQQRKQLYGEIDIARARHARLMDRLRGTGGGVALSLLRAPAQVQIVDYPADPTRPLTSKLKILLLGIAASLAFSLGLATLVEQIDPMLRSAEQLESATGLPVLARLERWPTAGAGAETVESLAAAAAARAQVLKAENANPAPSTNVKQIRS